MVFVKQLNFFKISVAKFQQLRPIWYQISTETPCFVSDRPPTATGADFRKVAESLSTSGTSKVGWPSPAQSSVNPAVIPLVKRVHNLNSQRNFYAAARKQQNVPVTFACGRLPLISLLYLRPRSGRRYYVLLQKFLFYLLPQDLRDGSTNVEHF